MKIFSTTLRAIAVSFFMLLPSFGFAAEIERFVGTYVGTADFTSGTETRQRDMSVTIDTAKDGFSLTWTSVSYKDDGRTKEKTYTIQFVPSSRENIYQSAMKTNLFGKAVPMDPLKGDPFVWARFEGDTFSVYSLFINEVGEYEIQEYHRTLVEGGLELVFLRVHNGAPEAEVRTILQRQD